MPWNDQSGDGKGGGPWGQGPQKPWGQQPQRPQPDDKGPDLEEMLRRLQGRVRGGRGGGGPLLPPFGRSGATLIAGLLVAGWLGSGIFVVDQGERGVVTRFGAFSRIEEPGLRMRLPTPFENHAIVGVTRQRNLKVGADEEESLMLTRDEAIVDIDFTVTWQLTERPQDFVFNVREPENLVHAVAESAMRETVGKTDLDSLLTTGRSDVENGTRDLMQAMLNTYKSGVKVVRVQLQKATAPGDVLDAFNDVDRARAEAESRVNEAGGIAAQMVQEAEAYRERVVREASGEAERFNLVYEQYRRSPRVTRERLYLETMERVYAGADKIIIDQRAGATPFLPLESLRSQPAQRSGQ